MKSPSLATKVTAFALAVLPSLRPADGAPSATQEREPTPATQPVGATQERESSTVFSHCLEAAREWRFMPAAVEKRYREIGENLRVKGFEGPVVDITFFPDNLAVMVATLKPSANSATISPDAAGQLFDKVIFPQCAEIGTLRREQLLSMTQITADLARDGSLMVTFKSYAGVKTMRYEASQPDMENLLTADRRALLWERAFATALKESVVPGYTGEREKEAAAAGLRALRDLYLLSDTPQLARLAQALLVRVDANVMTLRTYADMGRIEAAEAAGFPEPFRRILQSIDPYVRNLPPPSYFEVLRERTKDAEMPSYVAALLKVELAAQVYPAGVIGIAELEMLEALRYARDEYGKLSEKTSQEGARIVQRYFSDHFANEYQFRDSTPGLSGGLACRRTDCSTRALMAKAMLDSMGLESGVEIISQVKDGQPVPGSISHMYNYVSGAGGRTYFDFSQGPGEPFAFNDNAAIIERYRNHHPIEVAVMFESEAGSKIAGELCKEPIVLELNAFIEAFNKHGGDLPQFLLDNPQAITVVNRLVSYSRQLDALFGIKEMEAWEAGTREALVRIMPGISLNGNAPTSRPAAR